MKNTSKMSLWVVMLMLEFIGGTAWSEKDNSKKDNTVTDQQEKTAASDAVAFKTSQTSG